MAERTTITRDALDSLFDALKRRGYTIIGPTRRDQVIVYEELDGPQQLPAGWSDIQEPGAYHLQRREDQALFRYVVGPHSWKRFLHVPAQRLAQVQRNGRGFHVTEEPANDTRYAFLGVRACELHAIAIQDRIFLEGHFVDPYYRARRQAALIIAVNCCEPAATCFCASMGCGPRVGRGGDLTLTEVLDGGRHFFVIENASERGLELLHEIPNHEASTDEVAAAERALAQAEARMERRLDTSGIKELLYNHQEHPHWDKVGNRCLSCANCTMVCPTCFCTTVEDVTDLTGEHAERWRKWDSCFTLDFSYIHGGSIRPSTKARYRQWLTHKLAYWQDQFGTSGCVGCGRCLTWCPVGIDLTTEVLAFRNDGPA